MNKANIKLLESGGYKYVLGARIKSEPEKVKNWILSLEKSNSKFNELQMENARLIISYSEKSEAHVCICFIAYKVSKELERVLKTKGINLSVGRVLDIAKTIQTIKKKLPTSHTTMKKTMLLSEKQKAIAMLYDEKFWENFQGVPGSKSGQQTENANSKNTV